MYKKTIDKKYFMESLNLTPLYYGTSDTIEISVSDINRPGLQLCGHFEYFTPVRVQIIGNAEMTYIRNLQPGIRKLRLHKYFSYPMPCVIITRGLTPPEDMIETAREHDIPVFVTQMITGPFIYDVTFFLDRELAKSICRHGGLMDIHGVGVFITGESGIGKSETMLELIQRGHRLVADDVVEMRKISNTLVGKAPDAIRYLIEAHGLGLIDVAALYGAGAIMEEKEIDLCVHLTEEENMPVNRLGSSNDTIVLLGTSIPKTTIPVKPGRNISIIVEIAARIFRLNNMGSEQSGSELNNRILKLLE